MPADPFVNDPSGHPLSDPYGNDPTGAPVDSDTIRVLRGDFIYYVRDTHRGFPLRGLDSGSIEGPIGDFLYEGLLMVLRSPVKIGVLRVRRDWTGKTEILHREVLRRGTDPGLVKAALAARVRDGDFDDA